VGVDWRLRTRVDDGDHFACHVGGSGFVARFIEEIPIDFKLQTLGGVRAGARARSSTHATVGAASHALAAACASACLGGSRGEATTVNVRPRAATIRMEAHNVVFEPYPS
jgi:hypothetical protein